jgi:hypothetical protein
VSLILLFTIAIISAVAQSTKTEVEETDNQTSLQGLTEAILIDGQPALRIILGKNNNSTQVKLQKRDGEDTLVFDVYKNQMQGKLNVSKSRIVFDPLGAKKNYFNIEKSKIKAVKLNKPLPGDRFIKMYFDDEEVSITVFWGEFTGVDKRTLGSANTFLLLTIQDFDSALSDFNKLTESVRPRDENEEIEEEETEAAVTDKYDRFQDITVVSTSKMLVRGSKRSIRTYAEYSFAGKSQQKPEKVSLYFYASATRPLFQEDNLKLNFLVDNKRVPLGEMKLADEEKTKTATKQTVVITLPYETFEQIAKGKTVEFQIGTLEYKLTDVHLEAFRKLLTYKIEE